VKRVKAWSRKKPGDTLTLDLVACRRLLAVLGMQLKQYEGEVTAYRILFESLQHMTPDISWSKHLAKIQNSRRLQRQLHRKYDAPLEKLLGTVERQISDQEVRSWLKPLKRHKFG